MRLRQVVLAARELDPVVDTLTSVFGIEVAFRDPGVAEFDLVNVVMPIGDTFLEVVSPVSDRAPAARFLDRRGDGGYMVILQSEDVDRDRVRLQRLGVRVVWKVDLPDMRGTHLHPRDVGGAILSLDWASPPSSWRWAGPEWEKKVHTDRVSRVAGVEMESPDPQGLARRWSEVLDIPVTENDEGRVIELSPGVVRFVAPGEARGEGVSGFDLETADREAVLARARDRGVPVADDTLTICGTRFRLVA